MKGGNDNRSSQSFAVIESLISGLRITPKGEEQLFDYFAQLAGDYGKSHVIKEVSRCETHFKIFDERTRSVAQELFDLVPPSKQSKEHLLLILLKILPITGTFVPHMVDGRPEPMVTKSGLPSWSSSVLAELDPIHAETWRVLWDTYEEVASLRFFWGNMLVAATEVRDSLLRFEALPPNPEPGFIEVLPAGRIRWKKKLVDLARVVLLMRARGVFGQMEINGITDEAGKRITFSGKSASLAKMMQQLSAGTYSGPPDDPHPEQTERLAEYLAYYFRPV